MTDDLPQGPARLLLSHKTDFVSVTYLPKRRTCMEDKTQANLVGSLARNMWRRLARQSLHPQDAQEFPNLGSTSTISGGDCVNDVRGQASSCLGRTIDKTVQDMSASLPADIETMEEPLSRFRRQNIRSSSGQPRALGSSAFLHAMPTHRLVGRSWAANQPDWPCPCPRLSLFLVVDWVVGQTCKAPGTLVPQGFGWRPRPQDPDLGAP